MPKQLRLQGRLDLLVREATDLAGAWIPGRSNDPYCLVTFGNFQVLRTQYIHDTLSPNWEKTGGVTVDINGDSKNIIFDIWNKNVLPFPDVRMGRALLPTKRILESWMNFEYEPIEQWLQVEPQGQILVSYRYEAGYVSSDLFDVPSVYFKAKTCNRLTPYICATCPPGMLPDVETAAGSIVAESFWDDLYVELSHARKFIYIAGWSVWTKLKLRRAEGCHEEDLGELLKRRAEEGVCVCVLIWNEWGGSMLGTLGTRDEETLEFFRKSKVHCASACRTSNAAERTDADASEYAKHVVYTHHQKTVCLDRDQELIAYVGGIDLCGGRWDRPDHPLFSTLRHEHANDYYQNMVGGTTVETGPRQPWQDVAAKLEGPVVRDIIDNFEARWKLQVKDLAKHLIRFAEPSDEDDEGESSTGIEGDGGSNGELCKNGCGRLVALGLSKSGKPYDTCCRLCKDDAHSAACRGLPVVPLPIRKNDSVRVWRAQVFRSIDWDAAFLRRQGSKIDPRLMRYKGVWYDKSCHTAYVHHIRRAQRFLYIENQYFMGSSHLWKVAMEGCENLVPVEIASKIASKIAAREPFHAYINIPMWPEGCPDSQVVQEILHWQHSSIEMMYGIVAEALEEIGDKATSPLDYLSFYCLGNRESEPFMVARTNTRSGNGNVSPNAGAFSLPPGACGYQRSGEYKPSAVAQVPVTIGGKDDDTIRSVPVTPGNTSEDLWAEQFASTSHNSESSAVARDKSTKMGALSVQSGNKTKSKKKKSKGPVPEETGSGFTQVLQGAYQRVTAYATAPQPTHQDFSSSSSSPLPNATASAKSMLAARRAPIYIHSKCMIVDDTYMIMGSANLNERSMNGMRDTEIIFGAYQPAFVESPHFGDVQAFRMQLWAAHLGIKDVSELDSFRNPQELQVILEIRERAQRNWDQYTQEKHVDLIGHLMPYPYTIKRDGASVRVTGTDSGCALQDASPKLQCFPDTRASIIGQASSLGYAGSSTVTM